ncbi:MAG: bifunctional hydroxymethylpyrimidine kinase/phosphomethylpyrimidine kinase [Lachnospiraceae bacterium]|nr:bifunctional hydroxymethylpyrimidine kinase/phosphomethylpyrimidine kinase [Lachnospiraceae bacterium]
MSSGKNGYAVVIGGVNVDIGGRSDAPMVARDSNPGVVTMSLGGVGRNIAHNMSLLGVKVRMLTALGDDHYARIITSSCEQLGIDLTDAMVIPGARTSTYLYLDDADGDMALAVSDMQIYDHVTPEYLESKMEIINGAAVVVADTNIPQETLEYLALYCTAPLFIDPVSTIKAARIKNILSKIHTLKPNKLEAELLTGIRIRDAASLQEAVQALLKAGVQRVFLSMGSEGVLAADKDQMLLMPCCPAVMANATGAGDAFTGALAWSFLEDRNLEESAAYSSAAAAMAVSSPLTINEEISPEALKRILEG